MRKPRIFFENIEAAYYISNEVHSDLPDLTDKDQEQLETFIFSSAQFCRIEILSYTIYSRGYAMVIKTPAPEKLTHEILEKMVGQYYGEPYKLRFQKLAAKRRSKEFIAANKNYRKKQYNVQAFVKLYAQKLSSSYNRRIVRKGAVWRQRFRSYPVQNHSDFLTEAISFAHTRPVHAGIVDNPDHCLFSSWNKAVNKSERWRETYRKTTGMNTWRAAEKIIVELDDYMKTRAFIPYLGSIDQKLADKYIRKNKVTEKHISLRQLTWEKMFNQLKEYGEEHGHYRLPRYASEYKELKKWLLNQKYYFRRGILKKEYIQLFESINFPLKVKQYGAEEPATYEYKLSDQWLKKFEIVKTYSEDNDGLKPPYSDEIVARWIKTQRSQLRKNKLKKAKIKLLDSINFPWE